MKQKVIVFDFDDTLVDTTSIRKHIVHLAQELGVSKLAALKARKEVRSSTKPFTIENYAKLLFPADKKKRQKLIESFNLMFGEKGAFNYSGVETFLKKLSKDYVLLLLTYGNKVLQQKKINQSGLGKFFKEIIICDDHTKIQPLKQLQKKYPHLLFVDNSKHIYYSARSLGVPTLWVTSNTKGADYFKQLAIRIKKRSF